MDAAETPKPQSRHGKLSDDNTVISFAAPKRLKARIKKLAKDSKRVPSAWLRIHLEKVVERAEAAARNASKTDAAS